jgi:glycerol-3-phosphate O-acyltransferase
LLAAQEHLDRPIQLVPVLILWQRGFDRPVHPAVRAILPDAERSAGLFRLWKLAWFAKDNLVQVGEPVDLRTFLERVDDPRRQRRTLYVLLRRFLRREAQVVRGPRLPSPADLKTMVLQAPPLRQLAREEAQRTGQPVERVQRRMDREYDKMAAHLRWWVVRVLELGLRPLWTWVYRGVDAPEEDMERIREAMRRGSAIILPSHKSHFDYLLIAWVFYNHKLTLPHVVAGANLAIPVVSFFLRSAGGFFIKRSFAGETLHPAILSRYVRELVHHQVPIEFYLEGGRTRSGKLLPPKLGILGMIFESAALRPRDQEVTLLPVALAYEQVAEQGAYLRELGGAEKRKEDLGEVARASSIVSRRLGKVYLRVGQPIELSTWVDASADTPGWMDRPREDRKRTLDTLARRVMVRVGFNTVLLPTTLVAMALLAHHRRGIPQSELLARIGRFRAFCARHHVPEAEGMRAFDEAIRLTLSRFAEQRLVEHLEHEGDRVWAVRVDKRLALDFTKNQGLHVFAAAGFVACALRARPPGWFRRADLIEDVALLLDMWEHEFILEPDLSPAGVTDAGLDDLRSHGAVVWEGTDGHMRVDPPRISEIYGLFRPFLEAWRVVLSQAQGLDGSGPGRKEWVRTLQRDVDRLLSTGLITRPEALSLVTLENTIKALLDRGVLFEEHGSLRADRARISPLLLRFTAMVGA